MSKPNLIDKLIHLHKSDGTQSGFVLLQGPDGKAQGWYDLRDAGEKANLDKEFERLYETEDERKMRWAKEAIEHEERMFSAAKQVHEWDGPIYHNDRFWLDISDIEDCPRYVWAAKAIAFEPLTAEQIWSSYMEMLDIGGESGTEPELGSLARLNEALDAFHAENESNLNGFYEVDRSKVIMLDQSPIPAE